MGVRGCNTVCGDVRESLSVDIPPGRTNPVGGLGLKTSLRARTTVLKITLTQLLNYNLYHNIIV